MIFYILKIALFAMFFYHLGVVKTTNPNLKWSETIQETTGNIFNLCNNFEFCKQLDKAGVS